MEWYQEIAQKHLDFINKQWNTTIEIYDGLEKLEISYIYFLYDWKNQIENPVYIGQTKNPNMRILYHKKEKVKIFDFCKLQLLLPQDQEDVDTIESLNIIRYLPKYNFGLKSCWFFVNQFDAIKQKKMYSDMDKYTINDFIEKIHEVRSFNIGNSKFWYWNDICQKIGLEIQDVDRVQ